MEPRRLLPLRRPLNMGCSLLKRDQDCVAGSSPLHCKKECDNFIPVVSIPFYFVNKDVIVDLCFVANHICVAFSQV